MRPSAIQNEIETYLRDKLDDNFLLTTQERLKILRAITDLCWNTKGALAILRSDTVAYRNNPLIRTWITILEFESKSSQGQ